MKKSRPPLDNSQGDLFAWADARPTAKIIDAMPSLVRKVAFEIIYRVPRRRGGGDPIPMKRKVA